jgi:hypothetical protein
VKKPYTAIVVTLLLVCGGSAGLAQEGAVTPPETAAKAKEDDRLPIQKQDEWQFFLSPYLWIPGMNANTTTLRKTTTIDLPWWEVASTLFSNTIGVMGRAEVWKGRWGGILDGYFAYIGGSGSFTGPSDQKTFGPLDFTLNKQISWRGFTFNVAIPGQVGPGTLTLIPSGSVKYISRMGNLDLGLRFLVGTLPLRSEKPLPAVSLELLGGPRYNYYRQYLRINLSTIRIAEAPIDIGRFSLNGKYQSVKNGVYTIDITKSYVEPFLGARIGFWLTPKILITLKGDVGGFGLVADDHVDCNFEVMFGYRVHKNIYAYAGYRAHGSWYNLGQDLTAVNLSGWFHGPVLGTTYAF